MVMSISLPSSSLRGLRMALASRRGAVDSSLLCAGWLGDLRAAGVFCTGAVQLGRHAGARKSRNSGAGVWTLRRWQLVRLASRMADIDADFALPRTRTQDLDRLVEAMTAVIGIEGRNYDRK